MSRPALGPRSLEAVSKACHRAHAVAWALTGPGKGWGRRPNPLGAPPLPPETRGGAAPHPPGDESASEAVRLRSNRRQVP